MSLFHPDLIEEGYIPFVPNQEGHDGQDVDDPVWESVMEDYACDPNDPSNMHTLGESEPVRVVGGQLDFGLNVAEEPEDSWVARETEHGEGHRQRGTKLPRTAMDVRELPATDWRTSTYSVDKALQVTYERKDRKRVILTNASAAIIYISNKSIPVSSGAFTGTPGTFPLAIGATIELLHWNEIYAAPATVGTAQLLGVIEEFVLDGREG